MTSTVAMHPGVLDELKRASKDGIHVEVWKVVERMADGQVRAPYQRDFAYQPGLNKAAFQDELHRKQNLVCPMGGGLHTYLSLHDAVYLASEIKAISGMGLFRAITPQGYSDLRVVRCSARLDQYIGGSLRKEPGFFRPAAGVVAVFKELWLHLDEMKP